MVWPQVRRCGHLSESKYDESLYDGSDDGVQLASVQTERAAKSIRADSPPCARSNPARKAKGMHQS